MKRKMIHVIWTMLTIASGLMLSNCSVQENDRVQLILKSTPFQFTKGTALSTLNNQKTSSTFQFPNDSTSFSVHLKINTVPQKDTTTLLKIDGVLELQSFLHSNDRRHQNYPSYTKDDGTVPVLQADLLLHRIVHREPSRKMRLGVPIAMFSQTEETHEVILHFSGIKWTMYVDNELVDNDFPIGYPQWGQQSTWQIDSSVVIQAELFAPAITPEPVQLSKPRVANEIQYWTPHWHNAWVGDVITTYYKGRYHLFYLFDRRGHTGKLGGGGHYFEHISTADFKTWVEHDPAIPLENQWETLGTGTPFLYNDRIAISYGLHTTRFFPKDMTALPMQQAYFDKHGYSGTFRYDTLSVFPAGATYALSDENGMNFKKSKILFHTSENPSVYTDPKGRLRMLANYGAKGTWESPQLEGGWKPINPNFPPGGDCTFFFHWGNHDYIIGGFSGYWSKPTNAPDTAFVNQAEKGLDFYNGMNVPAISEINDNRYLIAAWIPMLNWGGTLNIHELIQYPSGRIGIKWMEEIIPSTEKPQTLTNELKESTTFDVPTSSFLLSFDVEPGTDPNSMLGVVLLGENGEEHACEVQISPQAKRAQYGKGSLQNYSAGEKSLREGGQPHRVRNYAIENLIDTEKPFTVRMIVKHENKYGGSQTDTEIAGQRTMISFRENLKVKKILFRSQNTGIKNLKIAALKK
jgi:beta-fructofuranosidase